MSFQEAINGNNEEFQQSMRAVRVMLTEKLEDLRAIHVPEVSALETFGRELFMRTLCTTALYENSTTPMQIAWLKTVRTGLDVDGTLEEFMRRALEVKVDDFESFLELMTDSPCRFYFTLDAMILTLLGTPQPENQKYLAELVQTMGLTLTELQNLSAIARAVVTQDLDKWREFDKFSTGQAHGLSFKPYLLRKQYTGPTEFINQGKVILENYDIDVTADWHFTGCTSVEFRNCTFKGSAHNISLDKIPTFHMTDCDVSGFTNRFMLCSAVDSFTVDGCCFADCSSTYDIYNDGSGGVFLFNYGASGVLQFTRNTFTRCYIQHRNNYYISGTVMGNNHCNDVTGLTSVTITGNSFRDCNYFGGTNRNKALFYLQNMSSSSITEKDNTITGGLTKIVATSF